MAKKRKQYFIKQFNFSNIKVNGDKLEFDIKLENQYVEMQNSENILFNTIYRITNKEYNEEDNKSNTLDEIFILNASGLDDTDEEQKNLYIKLMKDGLYINNIHFKRFGKSSSMAMRKRTLFVRADFHDQLKKYISLGKTPVKTVISKYETALGLSLSSLNIIEDLPRIAIVKDFEQTVIDDVKMVSKFEINEDDKEYKEYLKLQESEQVYKDKVAESKEYFKQNSLRNNFPLVVDEECKSRSAWHRENKRVKIDQLDKPVGYKVWKAENKPYEVYSIDQTEEMPNLINKYSLGYELKVVNNHPNEIVPFDGQGLVNIDYAKKLSEALEIGHVSNGFQIRMPYIKSFIVTMDFKKWFEKHGVTEIIDLWNNPVNVNDIDIILTESCFKAKLEATEEGNTWLFSSIDEYTDLLREYGHNYIGVTNYVKSINQTDIYTTLNYQFINSLNLNLQDLFDLAYRHGKMYVNMLKYPDTASVKAFLNMIINDGENYEERLDTTIQKAIDIDARMIFDPRVQTFLKGRVMEALEKMLIGKIPIKADYKFITGDCIAFLEFVSGKTVKGFLNANEFYVNGKSGEHVMMRNPLTSWHEVKKGNFVKSDNQYIKHLNNVIQLNIYDLTMPQLSGADVDGDKVILSAEKIILNAILDDLVIVNDDDKTTAQAHEYKIKNIIDFELRNLNNMTATVTNINTLIQSRAFEKGDLRDSELAIATCKQLQAEFIDSVKKGNTPIIPEVLLEDRNFKPYFQKFIYEGMGSENKRYLEIYSPLNRFSKAIEKLLKSIKENNGNTTSEYINISTYELITDMSKVDQATFFDYVEKISPIYNEYANKKGEIWREEKKLKKNRASDEEKEQIKVIKEKYKELYKDTKDKMNKICDNPSVLTTVCAYIEYKASKNSSKKENQVKRTKSYIFPWICTDDGIGLLENLKAHEDTKKIDVIEVSQLNRKEKEYEGILIVKDGIASIEEVRFKTDLSDGRYRVFNQIGYHFIDFDNDRETKVETSESKTVKSSEEVKELKEIMNYKVRLVNMESGETTSFKIDGEVIRLDQNGKYLGIFLNGEYVCGVAQENYIDDTQRVFLSDYVGTEFKVNVEKVGKKSLTVNLSGV